MYRILNEIVLKASSVSTMNYFREIVSDGPAKLLTCISTSLASVLSTFFMPIWIPIISVGVLIIIDMILGIRVALSKGDKIESRRAWATIKKLGFSTLMISCGHLVDQYILTSFSAHLVEGFAGLIAGVELWSMIENLHTLDPTGPWKLFSKFLKKKGEKYLDITIDKEDLPKIKKLVKKIK